MNFGNVQIDVTDWPKREQFRITIYGQDGYHFREGNADKIVEFFRRWFTGITDRPDFYPTCPACGNQHKGRDQVCDNCATYARDPFGAGVSRL